MSGFYNLEYLAEDHPMRNAPLAEIGAQFKHCMGHEFKTVEPGRGLAFDTYNTLQGAWLSFFEWRVPKETHK
jgi:hypothetical protein